MPKQESDSGEPQGPYRSTRRAAKQAELNGGYGSQDGYPNANAHPNATEFFADGTSSAAAPRSNGAEYDRTHQSYPSGDHSVYPPPKPDAHGQNGIDSTRTSSQGSSNSGGSYESRGPPNPEQVEHSEAQQQEASRNSLLSPFAPSEPGYHQAMHPGNSAPAWQAGPPPPDGRPPQAPEYGGYSATPTAAGDIPSSATQTPEQHHPHHPPYPMPPPNPSLPMTYAPFNFRPPPDQSAGDPSQAGPMPQPYNPHYPPHPYGMPPPGVYPMAPGYPTHPEQPQYPGYHPYPYPGYPPYPYPAPHHRYGSPDINGNITPSNGPPGVVFARAADPRTVRPKVKLTYDDKRRIVEIARSNSSLRQEDIAQQYGVDRSTISKILISAHRWTGPPQPPVVPIPKPPKQGGGGRFPAIEQRMHDWMDAQFDNGYEVRDNQARDKAKEIAREMGFTEERFKASAKWLDKFKERRKANGQRASVTASYESSRPGLPDSELSSPAGSPAQAPHQQHQSIIYPAGHVNGGYPQQPPMGYYHSPTQSQYAQSTMAPPPLQRPLSPSGSQPNISRSQSSATLASTDSGNILPNRQRSRSSPQRPGDVPTDGAALDPASGRVNRPSTGGLMRHNSVHGSGLASPRRPMSALSRTNSNASSVSGKGRRPTSLAASAFGLTSMGSGSGHSATTPTPGSVQMSSPGGEDGYGHPHANHPSSGHSLQPLSSLSGMSISPGGGGHTHGTLSSSSSATSLNGHSQNGPPPLTPLSPALYGARDPLQQTSGYYRAPPPPARDNQPQYAYAYSGYSGSTSQPNSAGYGEGPKAWRDD